MKKVKLIISVMLVMCLSFSIVGCADSFKPADIVVVENINGLKYEYYINDKTVVNKIWGKVYDLECDLDEDGKPNGKQGSSYLYFSFYDEKREEEAVFTIYDTGSCCIAKDFETFYALPDGVQLYLDFEELCTPFRKNAQQIK